MNKTLVMLVILAALVLVLIASSHALTAEASGRVCPSPGTGLPGALNMTRDAKMDAIMDAHTAPQGDAGMFTAVENSDCD